MAGYDYLMFGRFQKKDRLSIFSLECLCIIFRLLANLANKI